MVLVTLFFSGKAGSMAEILKQLLVSFLYGFGIVYLFIGLTKKMFKYNPNLVQIIKWATSLAALVAVCQFAQEVYQTYLEAIKGQTPQ
jgi:glucan phosphoethanolaminetransferase (alkaline phosphatase superfamily)